jgi:hypothetical protein
MKKSHTFLFLLAAGAVLCCLVCNTGCTSQSTSIGEAESRVSADTISAALEAYTNQADGRVPNGTLPDGMVPNGTPPDGMLFNGTPPDGMVPNGTSQDGMMPDGNMIPGRTPPDGKMMPAGTPPDFGGTTGG